MRFLLRALVTAITEFVAVFAALAVWAVVVDVWQRSGQRQSR